MNNKISKNPVNIKTRRIAFKTVATVGTAVVPAAWMTKKHMDFYPKESMLEQRKNMRNRMLGFFIGMVPGLLMVHKAARRSLKKSKNMLLGIAGSVLTALGAKIGVEVGRKIKTK